MRRNQTAGLLPWAVLVAFAPAPALAASCGSPPATPSAPQAALTPPTDGRIHITADQATLESRDLTVFTGHVVARYHTETVVADRMQYNRKTGLLKARGHVRVADTHGDAVKSDRFDFNPATGIGRSGRVTYQVTSGTGHGDASTVTFGNAHSLSLTDARYTTCPEPHSAWYIVASHLAIDPAHNEAVAHNARFDFYGVPIFYSPYLSVPTSNARKSGLLAPRYGVRGNAGVAFSIPYYWNIAPSLDDTLTPTIFSRRGLQWANDTRYIAPNTSGNLSWEYLHHDRVYGGNRYDINFTHQEVLSPHWSLNLNYQKVSDMNYLGDFSESLAGSSQTDLTQQAEADYDGDVWQVRTLASRFQNLDPTVSSTGLPYTRLPEIDFDAEPARGPDHLSYSVTGSVVNFVGNPVVDGKRLDFYSKVSYEIRTADGFFKPSVGVRETDYSLANGVGGLGAYPTALTRTVPIVSIDSGLFFERSLDHERYTQTLEPRLFYLYVPYVNQDNFPNFDTIVPDFNFTNLFLDNRFYGADRIGDANQLTAAVTTRFLGPDGNQVLSGSLGRVFYFAPQRVNLPPGLVYDNRSDWAGQGSARLSQSWYVRSGFEYDTTSRSTKWSDFYFGYEPKPDRILNFGREYIAGVQNEAIVSAEWPVWHHFAVVGENQYSLVTHNNLESYLGIQYNACCWVARVYFHRQLSPTLAQVDSVMFQFELTGIASLGSPPINPVADESFLFGQP